MDKKQLNEVLKAAGVILISQNIDLYKTKAIKGVKGIKGGNVGPLTATNAYMDVNKAVEEKIHKALFPLCSDYDKKDGITMYGIETSETSKRVITFTWQTFPTWAGNTHDPEYQTFWFVSAIQDVKVIRIKA